MGLKQVGVFKGLIRIKLDNNKSDEIFGEALLKQLLKPKGYAIRLYLLEAKGLTPMVIIYILTCIHTNIHPYTHTCIYMYVYIPTWCCRMSICLVSLPNLTLM